MCQFVEKDELWSIASTVAIVSIRNSTIKMNRNLRQYVSEFPSVNALIANALDKTLPYEGSSNACSVLSYAYTYLPQLYDQKEIAEGLVQVLRERTEQEIRIMVCEGIWRACSARKKITVTVVDPLLEILQEESDSRVKEEIVRTLGLLEYFCPQPEKVFNTLVRLARHDLEPEVRCAAVCSAKGANRKQREILHLLYQDLAENDLSQSVRNEAEAGMEWVVKAREFDN